MFHTPSGGEGQNMRGARPPGGNQANGEPCTWSAGYEMNQSRTFQGLEKTSKTFQKQLQTMTKDMKNNENPEFFRILMSFTLVYVVLYVFQTTNPIRFKNLVSKISKPSKKLQQTFIIFILLTRKSCVFSPLQHKFFSFFHTRHLDLLFSCCFLKPKP